MTILNQAMTRLESGMRLRKVGFDGQQQHPLNVYDEDGTPLGEYFADLLIEGRIQFSISRAVPDIFV